MYNTDCVSHERILCRQVGRQVGRLVHDIFTPPVIDCFFSFFVFFLHSNKAFYRRTIKKIVSCVGKKKKINILLNILAAGV